MPDSPSLSRALVSLAESVADGHPHRPIQRVSTFLTHLIATALKEPQACAKRRADPAEVIAAYRATVARLQNLNTKSQ